MIQSSQNPKFKWLRNLQESRAARLSENLFVLEGTRAISTACEQGNPLRWVLHTEESARANPALFAALESQGVSLTAATPSILASCSATEHSQGIIAVAECPRWSLPAQPKFVLLCDGISDPGNMGTILRTAAAAQVQMVLLMPGTVDIYNPKVVRGTMGAILTQPTMTTGWEAAREWWGDLPCWLADTDGEHPYYHARWQPACSLIVSSEAKGPSEAARQMATDTVRIPYPGAVESLNVAVATGILLLEIATHRARQQPGR